MRYYLLTKNRRGDVLVAEKVNFSATSLCRIEADRDFPEMRVQRATSGWARLKQALFGRRNEH